MNPLSFQWEWSMDYTIITGLLYLLLAVVLCGLIYMYPRNLFKKEGNPEKALPDKISYRSKYSEY